LRISFNFVAIAAGLASSARPTRLHVFHTGRVVGGHCHHRHPDRQFSLADGSVHFVSETIDINIYRKMGIRDDGLPMGGLP